MNHRFTFKESMLLLVACIMALCVFCYQVAYVGINNQIASYDTTELQEEIDVEVAKTARISSMKQIIKEAEGRVVGSLSVYDNITNEIIEMDDIFDENVQNVSISWSDPTLTNTIVRRDCSVSFHTNSYKDFINTLKRLSECQYRCLINNVSVSGYDADNAVGIQDCSDINATVSLTFYETSDGATSLDGLVIVQSSDESDETLEEELSSRADAYSDYE